jgi:hypothetical protein
MHISDSSSRPSPTASHSTTAPTDRRQRGRLRDLCDEVLASFRMAREPDQFSEQDRAQGRALVSRIARQTR